jgi:N-acetylmuramoyl-L-alanine amidase
MKPTKIKGRITLALILAAMSMAALATEKFNDVTPSSSNSDSGTVSDELIHHGPVKGIAIGVAQSYHTSETPATAPEATEVEGPVPVLPIADTGPETASTEALTIDDVDVLLEGIEDEVVPEKSWYDVIVDVLWADEDSIRSKAIFIKKKHDIKKKYGDTSIVEPNLTTILQIEADSKAADEVRQQKQLALEIAEANRQQLYHESLECLALNGFHEARGETADQELASAAVVLNRLSVGFRGATTVCEVIYTPKQFSWVEQIGTHTPDTSNKIEKQAWERSLLIARRMLDADAMFVDPSNGALYYYNPSIVDWKYKHAYRKVAQLGNHLFMTEKDENHPHYIDNHYVRINPALLNGLSHQDRKSLIAQYKKVGS